MKKVVLSLASSALLLTACQKKEEAKVQEEPAPVESTTPAVSSIQHQLQWIAYKLPEKAGVKGTFSKIDLYTKHLGEASLEAELNHADFNISSATVSSGDPTRDTKLKDFFFAKMLGDIKGSFGEFKDEKVPVTITMNEVTKEVPFTYRKNGDTLVIQGKIDIVKDFSANMAFQSIAEACKDLHQNKTWPDVDIEAKFYK